MKWKPYPKYKPTSDSGECFVVTDHVDLWIATYKYSDKYENYIWIAETDGMKLSCVTHFCIPDPVKQYDQDA